MAGLWDTVRKYRVPTAIIASAVLLLAASTFLGRLVYLNLTQPHLDPHDQSVVVAYGESADVELADPAQFPNRDGLHATALSDMDSWGQIEGTALHLKIARGEFGPLRLQYVLQQGDVRSKPTNVAIEVRLGIKLLPVNAELHPNETKEIAVLTGVSIPDELFPAKLRLAVLHPVTVGTAAVTETGRQIKYTASRDVASDIKIAFGLVPVGGTHPVAESVLSVSVTPPPPPPPQQQPPPLIDCGKTSVPGGMFLVAAKKYEIPNDAWAKWFFRTFGAVTEINIEKSFCIQRRELHAGELTPFAKQLSDTDKDGWRQLTDEFAVTLTDETADDAPPLASNMTHRFAEKYAEWASATEAGLRLPSRDEWLAAVIVAMGGDQGKGVYETFRKGVREWSRDTCELAGESGPHYLALGQPTTAQRQEDPTWFCREEDVRFPETGLRLVKEATR